MVDPVTTNRQLSIPTRGSDSGTWDVPNNGNFAALDTLFGGAVTKSLTNVNVALTTIEQQNALIKLTGALTGNCDIQFNAPGFYILHNACTVGGFYVRLVNVSGAGNKIGAPPGRKCHVYFDGTDMDYVDMPEVGSYLDLPVAAVPAWIGACTVAPWLVCDGSTKAIATYPQLAAILGTTFGGNGISTFGMPDLRSRARVSVDTDAGGFAGRLSSGVSGINGRTLGAAGGDQNMPVHSHGITDPGHAHNIPGPANTLQATTTPGSQLFANAGQIGTDPAFTNIGINNAGSGGSGNVPPTIVAGLSFIKT